ncbi:MAG: hypothetical protein ACYS1C_13035 [Planctomycetota bacterium]|jgi:hypothetical protein
MNRSRSAKQGLLDRLKAAVLREQKKAIILAALLAVLAVIGGWRALGWLRPARAAAASVPNQVPPAALAAAKGGAAGQRRGKTANGEDPLGLANLVVDRDIFTPNPVYFPPKRKGDPKSAVPPLRDPAAEREARKKAIEAQARALKLQSTMLTVPPSAIINDRVLRIGDWISGFVVVTINARACTLEKEDVRVSLVMSK